MRGAQHPRCVFLATDSAAVRRAWRRVCTARGLPMLTQEGAGEAESGNPGGRQRNAPAQWPLPLKAAAADAQKNASRSSGQPKRLRPTDVAGAVVDLYLLAACGWLMGTRMSSFTLSAVRLRFRPLERLALLVPEPRGYWTAVFKAGHD